MTRRRRRLNSRRHITKSAYAKCNRDLSGSLIILIKTSDSSYLATLACERSEMKPRCGFVAYPALLVHLQLQKLYKLFEGDTSESVTSAHPWKNKVRCYRMVGRRTGFLRSLRFLFLPRYLTDVRTGFGVREK